MIETVGWAKDTALHFWCRLLFCAEAGSHTHSTLFFVSRFIMTDDD